MERTEYMLYNINLTMDMLFNYNLYVCHPTDVTKHVPPIPSPLMCPCSSQLLPQSGGWHIIIQWAFIIGLLIHLILFYKHKVV